MTSLTGDTAVSLTLDRVVIDIMTARVTVDPWLALVGSVELRTSGYVARGQAFAMDHGLSGFADLGKSALIHPDDADAFRDAMRKAVCLNLAPSDSELAAWVYYIARADALTA